MTTLQISEDILPLGHFKSNASRILKGLKDHNRPIVITQNGKPTAVVLSPAEFDRLNTHARFVDAVQRGLDDEQAGRVISDDELTARLDREFQTP